MFRKKNFMFIANPNKRPCSKHGGSHRYNKEGCINYINVEDVVKTIKGILLDFSSKTRRL